MPDKISWSHSRLQTFEQCPRRFYHECVVRDCKQEATHPTTIWGQEVHKAAELRVKDGTPLPANMAQYAPVVDILASLPRVQAEVQFAVNERWERTEWTAADTWGRAIIDVLYIDYGGRMAYVADYKLGKYRGDTGQARVNALMLMMTDPGIDTVHTQFLYFAAKKVDTNTFTRDKLPQYAELTLEVLRRIETCNASNAWHATPSGLCAYCPATRCQFNRSKR